MRASRKSKLKLRDRHVRSSYVANQAQVDQFLHFSPGFYKFRVDVGFCFFAAQR